MVANPQGLEEFKVIDPLKRIAYAPFRMWVREGCRAADRVIATDEATRGEVSQLLDVPERKVVVIPNGVDLEVVRGLVNRNVQARLIERWPALGNNNGTLKGISVGRLEANKGFEFLLRALAFAGDGLGPGWVWVMVGDGSQRQSLEELATGLGLGERVIFAGRLDDSELHSLYALCNLFAHPTLYEGSSLVTLEAMAHALPVVASRTGGIPDKVIAGETGFLVPPGDADALARRIAWIAAHPPERAEMGRRGEALAANFGWDSIAERTGALFRSLIAQKATCSAEGAVATSC
jgi:glycosyltransferase involved in cell wall biosynthesis